MQHADKLETLPIDSLVPYARNARTHSPEQVAAVARSIQRFGFTNPVLIDAEGGIVAGHGRVMAAKSLGMGQVPCLRVGWLTEAEKRAYVLADNKLAELAGWDDELLAGELRALQADDFDLSLTGFAQDELDDLLIDKTEGKTDPDAVPPAPTIPVTQPGDVWVLGRHRIMCGDSTDAGSVALLMNGEKADMCFTSPPYGAGNVAKLRDHYVRGADNRESFYDQHKDRPSEWADLMRGWYVAAKQFCGVIVCNVQMLADNKVAMVEWLHAVRADLCDVVVWDKGHGAPQMQSNIMNNAFEFVFVIGGNGSRSVPFASFHGNVPNVVRVNPKGKNDHAEIHRAVMPVDLALWAIRDLCVNAASVFEPFSGSGTTIIAAEQTGRRCYAMELSPQYVDVAVRRWQQFTGLRAVRESDGVEFPGMSIVTRSDFARQMGVNKSTVTRWAEKGQIVFAPEGGVDVAASRQRLQDTGGARPDVAERHAAERGAALKVGADSTAQAAPAPQQDDRVGNSFQAARAVKEKYAALAAKLDYERATGNLIPKEDVDAALKALGASVRARLDVLADQLAPVVAPVADLDEVHAVLAEHFRAVLAGIADDLHRQEVAG